MKAIQTLFNPKFTRKIKQLDYLKHEVRKFLSIPDRAIFYPTIKHKQLWIFTSDKILLNRLRDQKILLNNLCNHLNSIFGLPLKKVHTKLIPCQVSSVSPERKVKKLPKEVETIINRLKKELNDC